MYCGSPSSRGAWPTSHWAKTLSKSMPTRTLIRGKCQWKNKYIKCHLKFLTCTARFFGRNLWRIIVFASAVIQARQSRHTCCWPFGSALCLDFGNQQVLKTSSPQWQLMGPFQLPPKQINWCWVRIMTRSGRQCAGCAQSSGPTCSPSAISLQHLDDLQVWLRKKMLDWSCIISSMK